jgi:apolipoprotein N-acyltransferase
VIANEAQTTDPAARQHARVSRLRAVETGLPLVRVANTGPTEWIDATGQLRASLPTGVAGTRIERVSLGGEPTLYTRLGDGSAFAAALLPTLLLPWLRSRSRSRSNRTSHTEETRS